MLFAHGGGLTKEIALRVPLVPAPDTHVTTLLHALLRWLELAVSRSCTSAAATRVVPGSSNSSTSAEAIARTDAQGDGATQTTAGAGSPSSCSPAEVEVAGRVTSDAAISVLRLLCEWVCDCPAAVRELLDNPANLFVVDVAAGRCSLFAEGVSGLGEGSGAAKGEVSRGATAVQRASVKGLACLMLGLLLEYVEEAAAPRSGSSGAGEWTRDVVMRMIQNRVGEATRGPVER